MATRLLPHNIMQQPSVRSTLVCSIVIRTRVAGYSNYFADLQCHDIYTVEGLGSHAAHKLIIWRRHQDSVYVLLLPICWRAEALRCWAIPT